jgi:hypothetical protein
MHIEEIQKFLSDKNSESDYVKISFKKRESVYGLFVIDHKDYSELKAKNFWRIVLRSQFDAYRQSKNIALAKIFSGSEFTRLTLQKDMVE